MALGTPGFSNIDGGGGGGGGAGVPLNFSQTKGAQVTITAAEAKPATVVSVTITTAGNPVQIIVSGDANPSGAGTWGLLNIYRGAVAIGQNVQFESSAANENVPYSLQVVDEPAAGTWTYSLKVVSVTANTQFGESAGPIITVTELGGVGTAVPSGAAGGDLGGTYPNPDVVAIQGYTVSTTAPGAGEALVWDGSNWVPTAVSAGAGGNDTNIQYNSGGSLAGTNNFIFDDTSTRVTLTDGSQALDVYPNLIEYVGAGSLQIEASTTVDVGTLTATGVNLGSATAATTIAGAFTLPTVDGASGEVLTTDGAGNVTWQAGGGGGSIGGTILATEVAFGTALDTVSGSSTFTYDSLNNTVALDKGTNLSGILVRDTPLTVTSDLQAGALVLNSSTEGATLSGTGVFLEMRYDTLVGQIPTIRAIDETTAAAPLDLSIGELRLNTAPGAAGEVLTSNGPGLAPTWQAGGGGSGAAGGANEIQYNDGSNALTASSGLTFDGTTLAVNSIGPSALTVSSTIDGQFLDVNTSLYQLTLLDPTQLPLNVNATLGPSDLAIYDDNVSQSGNVQAGLVGVFDNATTNNLKMIIPAGVATIKSEDALSAAQALNLSIEELQINGAPGAAGEVLTSNGPGSAPTWQASGGGGGAAFAGALTIYVDAVSGSDITGNGTLGSPYSSINYAYSQVPSFGAPANVAYNAQVGQFVTEKLIFRLAPGRYIENVVLGFKRGRVQLIGNGVQIVGSVTMRALRADFPAASMEAIKSSFPTPFTGAGTLSTFEITGEAGGGVESDATSDPFLITGLTTLLFDEPTLPGSGLGTTWENNYGQFNFYANKSYLIGGMVTATSYTVPTTNGHPTSVIEIDSCTIGESSITYRSYLGTVPYAYAANPTLWNQGTGVATGAGQSTTTLVDTTKSWTTNQYAGATLSLTTGTGAGQTVTVSSNTSNTLTFPALATAPVAASTTYSLVGTTNKAPTGTITLKCHNSTIGAAIGPRNSIGEIDGCRLYDIDRTMLGTVDNGSVVGSTSTSYLGLVINQFRQYSGTGYPASQYQIGSSLSGTRYKMDSTSYTTLAFSRSGAGVLSARTLNVPTSSGTATSGAATTLTDTSKTWNTNQWAGGSITLTGGTGSGQTRTISSNTSTAITVSPAWATNPAAGTTYTVTALVAYDLLDDARSLAYTPTTGANWLDPDPTTVGSALDKVGALGLLAAAPSSGQIPIGNGTNFTPATLTAGAGVTITNAAGSVTVVGNLSPLGSVGATPTAANLRTNATYTVNVAAVALPAMAAGDDGLTISLVNISGANSTVTPSTGVARTMTTGGGQTWVWLNTGTTWYCISNV